MFKSKNKSLILVAEITLVGIIALVFKNAALYMVVLMLSIYGLYSIIRGYLCKGYREHRKYEKALSAFNGAVWEWYEEYGVLFISSRYKKVFNNEENIDSFEALYTIVNSSDRERVKKIFEEYTQEHREGEIKFIFKTILINGEMLYIECTGKGAFVKGKYELNGILIDVTEREKQESILKIKEKKYRRALEGSKEIMFYHNIETGVYSFSDRDGMIFKADKEVEYKINTEEWLEVILPKDRHLYLDEYTKFLDDESKYFSAEYRVENINGDTKWISQRGKRVIEEDGVYIYGSISDISDDKEKEAQIYYMSNFDYVTGLPNRRYFNERADELLRESKNKNMGFAIVFIDLDDFKLINDTFGHDTGDKVLKIFCQLLNEAINDKCTLARFGGDEFIIGIGMLENQEEVLPILNRIISNFNKPLKVVGKEIFCTVSIGVSFYNKDGKSIPNLLKRADIAMYKAKAIGKNRYCLFNQDLSDEVNRESEIKRCLRSAIENKEIYFEYQPKCWSNTRRIEGFECLAKWKNNELGFVSPSEFIPVAESTGGIVAIGKYLMEEAFKKCNELKASLGENFKIAINLSQVQIRDESILTFIEEKIKEYDINPNNLEFEVTESVIMQSLEENVKMLRRLKEIGISIALDDFGTGYSSLNYLKTLPIDKVKIDKSFINDIGIDNRNECIIEKVVELSHMLNLKVVAEGVESERQLKFLEDINCDIIQGYYYSRPLEFHKLINEFILNNR